MACTTTFEISASFTRVKEKKWLMPLSGLGVGCGAFHEMRQATYQNQTLEKAPSSPTAAKQHAKSATGGTRPTMDAPDASPPSASPQRLDFIAWCEAKINPRLPAPVRDQVRAAIRAVKWDDAAQTPRKLALQDAYVRLQQQYRDAPAHDAAGAVPDLVDLETLRCWNSGLTHEAVTFLLARHGGWDAARCVDPDNTTVQSKRYRDVSRVQVACCRSLDCLGPLRRVLTPDDTKG